MIKLVTLARLKLQLFCLCVTEFYVCVIYYN